MRLGDARKLDQGTQEALRKRAVLLVINGGKTLPEAAIAVGVARGTVSRWVTSYRKVGEAGILRKRRGRRHGEQAVLSAKQCGEIRRLIADKCPAQLPLPFVLWTRKAVRNLIRER